jgi:uncharacterized cupin superfamily protein
MTNRRDILNVADIPTRTFHSGPRFEVALGDIDGALGTTQIGATLHIVPAGKTAWPYHRHHGNDELFYVLAGEGTYRLGDRRLPIKAGDLIGAPALHRVRQSRARRPGRVPGQRADQHRHRARQ